MRPSLRVATLALLALSGITCTDSLTSPHGGPVVVNIAPSFSTVGMQSLGDLAAFNLGIDNIHVHIDHPPVAAFDKVVSVAANADTVLLTLDVVLNTSPEQLTVQLELRHGTQVVYSGSQTVTARAGAASSTGAVTIPVSYVGPGAGIASFSMAPSDTTIDITHSVPFRLLELDNTQHPVSQVVAPLWTIADSALGTVAPTSGAFQAGSDSGTTQVIATLPNGLSDTATVHVVIPQGHVAVVSGNNQIGLPSTLLTDSLVVKVTNDSGRALPGTNVVWSASDGHQNFSPLTSVTDSAGLAATAYTLPGTIGTITITATLLNGSTTTFTEQAVSSTLGSLHFAVQPSNALAASAILPPIQVEVLTPQGQRDSTGTYSTATIALSVLHGPLGGHVGDSTGLAADTVQAVNGVATFLVGDEVAGTYKLLATSPGLNPDSSVAYTISVGPASHLQITLGGGSMVGFASDTTTIRPTVRVLDAGGNAVAGATVKWVVDSGGGGLVPTSAIVLPGSSTLNTTSDSTGTTTVLWTMGTSGSQQMHAMVTGVPDTAHFTATISTASGVPVNMTAVGDSGLLTQDTVGTSTRTFAVQVRDSAGGNVSGTPVTFYVIATSGSTCSLPGDSGTVSVNTNSSGQAAVALQLPPNATSCNVEAMAFTQAGGLVNGSPVTFTEIVAPPRATVWLAKVDSLWSNAANWSNGVPTESDSAFLPWLINAANLNGNASVGTLIIENGANFELRGDTLHVYGNLSPPLHNAVAVWSMTGADTGAVEMMTPGSQLALLTPADLMIGDASMACAGVEPVKITSEVIARNVTVSCPATLSLDGSGWLVASRDINIQHHGLLTMTSGQTVYAGRNFSVTSDQSSQGALSYGTLTIGGNFTQDTVAGAPDSYLNFRSTGLSVIMASSDSGATQTISATSNQTQFWDLMALASDSGKVQFSPSGATTYTVSDLLTVSGASGLEQLTIPSGVTLNVGGLTLNAPTQFVVNGAFNSSTDCDASILQYIVLGPNGAITPASCHP